MAENGTKWQGFENGLGFEMTCKLLKMKGLCRSWVARCSKTSDKPEVTPLADDPTNPTAALFAFRIHERFQ
jgi:hypothetical protein